MANLFLFLFLLFFGLNYKHLFLTVVELGKFRSKGTGQTQSLMRICFLVQKWLSSPHMVEELREFSGASFFIFIFNFELYFIDYAVTVVLIFPLSSLSPQHPHSLRQSPHHCSCPWVMRVSSLAAPCPIPFFTSPWLFCNYLFYF